MKSPEKTPSNLKSAGPIAIVVDERISHEQGKVFNRLLTLLRSRYQLETIRGDITEADFLKKIEANRYALSLLPWYRYLAWTKVEAYYGLTRTSGPTVAGYFADDIHGYELIEPAETLRTILLDFHALKSNELNTILDSLLEPGRRSGLHPLIDKAARIYSDLWPANKQLGAMLDSVCGIPGLNEHGYLESRAHAVRLALSALWSLVFEEGPGKTDFGRDPKATRAILQISPGPHSLLLRLCFPWPGKTQRDLLNLFWPDDGRQSSKAVNAPRILAQHADFLRAHTYSESNEVEITVGFVRSAPSQNKAGCLHTLWVEPLAPTVFHESLFTPQGTARFVGLPPQTQAVQPASPSAPPGPGANPPAPTMSPDSLAKLALLTRKLQEAETQIAELKAGGVGLRQDVTREPPSPEELLESFTQHYASLRREVENLEADLRKATAEGKSRADVATLIARLTESEERLNRWTAKIDAVTRLQDELKEAG